MRIKSLLLLALLALFLGVVSTGEAALNLEPEFLTPAGVDAQGIMPRGQLTELYYIRVEDADATADADYGILGTLDFKFEKYTASPYRTENTFGVEDLAYLYVYRGPDTWAGDDPSFDPDASGMELIDTYDIQAGGLLGTLDFSDDNDELNDVVYIYYIVLETADVAEGIIDGSLTPVNERGIAAFTFYVGTLSYTDYPTTYPLVDSEPGTEVIDARSTTPIVFESTARNVYQYYHFSLDDDDYDVTYSDRLPATFNFPGYSERPRGDLDLAGTEASGSPPRPIMHQVVPLETPTPVLGIACAGGTDSKGRGEWLRQLTIKFKTLTTSGFDPETMLDPITPKFPIFSDSIYPYSGVMVYKDAQAEDEAGYGEWDADDTPVPPYDCNDADAYDYAWTSATSGDDTIYTLTYDVGYFTYDCNDIPIQPREEYLFFVVIRVDSGNNDENPYRGGEDTPVLLGANFQVYIDDNGVSFHRAYTDHAANPTSAFSNAGDTVITDELVTLYPGARLRTYVSTESTLGWYQVDATSPAIPLFGLNVADTADTVVVQHVDLKLASVTVKFTNENSVGEILSGSTFDPETDLAGLTGDYNDRGVSLWKDNKSVGAIGVFDEANDTCVAIDDLEWTEEDEEWSIVLAPNDEIQEIYPNDTYTGGYRGDDYFVCIRTSSDIVYNDKFAAKIEANDINFAAAEDLSTQFIISSATLQTNVPTFLTDLTNDITNQIIAKSSDRTAVLGINLVNASGRDVDFRKLIVEFYDKGGFNPESDLKPMATGDTSGLALYKDVNGDGAFTYAADAGGIVTLDAVPDLLGLPGEPEFQYLLEFATAQTIPATDAGDDEGDDYFVVIRTSSTIDVYDRFRVAIVGWGSEPAGNYALSYYDNDSAAATYSYERLETSTLYAISRYTEGSSGGVADSTQGSGGGGGGGCFIATAAYGTPLAEEVKYLSKFRDEYLLTNRPGCALVDTYCRLSPPVADFIREHEGAKKVVRLLLRPLIWLAKLLTG